MPEVDQSTNPYAPPSSPVKAVPAADVDDVDEIQDELSRAFYAATYGTIFLPGVAYCIALFLLTRVGLKREEFMHHHHKQFTTVAVICILQAPLMFAAMLGVLGMLVTEAI